MQNYAGIVKWFLYLVCMESQKLQYPPIIKSGSVKLAREIQMQYFRLVAKNFARCLKLPYYLRKTK